MTFRFVSVLLGVGFGILGAGCRTTGEPGVEVGTSKSLRYPTDSKKTGIDPKNGYMSNRWIGLRSQGRGGCPKVEGWTGEPLLGKGAASREIRELELDRFCAYTPHSSFVQRFVPPPGLQAERDRLSLSASANGLMEGSRLASKSNEVDAVLALEFLSQAGQMSPLPGFPSDSLGVQVTILDSQPDGLLSAPDLPGSQHGFAVTQLVRKLVCNGDGNACAATVLPERALNYDDPNQTTTPLPSNLPGSIGTISDLGLAIINAVNASSPSRHLILNLSIGWDGETLLNGLRTDLGAREASELEPSVQFVHRALRLAARKGVLVIAAAGNRRGGSLEDSQWPILPAAWELRRPSRSRFGRPLIYAVGGVDWQGLPLPNARTHGLPRRAAYGDHATAEVDSTPTTVYTGTSVSTAVVSATAAVIWHLRPELKPAEVMRLIDSSGETQAARADFYPGSHSPSPPPAPQIREISLCAAVKAACSKFGLNCPTRACPPQHQPPALSALLAQPDPGSGTPFQPTGFPSPPPSLPPCHQGTMLLTAPGNPPVAQPVCPTDQYSSISAWPWVLPQPGDDPCPNCTLVKGPPLVSSLAPSVSAGPSALARALDVRSLTYYQLAIALNQHWIDTLHDVSLNVTAMLDIDCFADGMLQQRRTYPVQIDYTANRAWTAFGFGDGGSLRGCRAQLNFVVHDATGTTLMSVQNPVVVDPDFSESAVVAVNPLGSGKILGVPSTKVLTLGDKKIVKAASPPL